MKVVIKIGTQSILSDNGEVLDSVLSNIVDQIARLQKNGHHVVLVSSGAVGSGRHVARAFLGREYGSSIGEKQVLAGLGQHELMHNYSLLFKKYGMLAAQLLLTKQDFHTRQHYLNIARLMREILGHNNIIPIINENDSVSIEELMFTDNDELAGLIAAQLGADMLVILTSVKGVYDGHPDDPNSKIVSIINPKEKWQQVPAIKTAQGRGGMVSKLSTARKISALGITTHIAHAQEKDVIIRIVDGEEIGSKVLPFKKKSKIKSWIAYSSGKNNGSIKINNCLYEIIAGQDKVVSILPVGIEKCSGDFEKGDLIDILAPNGNKIGIGIAKYGAAKLKDFLGSKGQPIFIHCDHLYIENNAL